jgi:hypothetical protein
MAHANEGEGRVDGTRRCKKSAAYEALRLVGGRFSHLLMQTGDGLIGLRAAKTNDHEQEI